ncbi:MAG: helix-turn-helix domain-containing protein, partial [Anaerolineae bacterium]|nr:helix-turn-helix domain-containing protein [Anaerolineae bacterium]
MSSDAELIGQRLREAREARELTLELAEQATRIRAKFLEALETGDYSSMSPVQAQGFIRNYARYLQLDIGLLMTELEDDSSRSRRRRRTALPKSSGAQTMPADPVMQSTPGGITPRTGRSRIARRRRSIIGNLLITILAGAIVVAAV